MLETRHEGSQIVRVLITGSQGFIGRHLIDELKLNFKDRIEIFAWQRIQQGDLRVKGVLEDAVRRLQPNVIVHLAWSRASLSDYALDPLNACWVDVGARLAKLAHRTGLWVMFAGSAADELSEDIYNTPYGRAKRDLREIVRDQLHEELYTWFRPQYVYSIQDRRPALLRQFFDSACSNDFHPERPNDLRDWVDVRDVASGLNAILQNRITGVVDLGSGKAHTVQEFLDAIRLGEVPTGPDLNFRHWDMAPSGCNTAALRQFGWSPTHTQLLFAGLEER